MRSNWWLVPAIGLVPFVLFLVLPPIEPLTPLGMKTVGILLCTIIWWIFLDVSYTSLMSIFLLVVTGVMGANQAFAASMGNWVVIFCIGCFGLCEGLRATGFTDRFTLWFLSRSVTNNRPWLLMTFLFLSCTIMGSVMTGSATCIVFMTIAISIFRVLGYRQGNALASLIIIGIAWSATASMAMTPIGHPTNLMMIDWLNRDFSYNVTFINWMLIGGPVGLVFCLGLVGFFRYAINPDVKEFSAATAEHASNELAKMGKIKKEEKVSVGVFLFIITLWVGRDMTAAFWPAVGVYLYELGYAAPALAGASLLCFIHVSGKPILKISQWFGGIEWGAILLVAGIMAIGAAIGNPDTGIAEFTGGLLLSLMELLPDPLFLPLIISWITIQTNIMSNMVSMTLVYNVIAPIINAGGLTNPVALGVTVAAASSYAFMLPTATTATALAIGSGWASPKQMLQLGAILIIPVILLFAFLFYPLATLVLR